MYKSIILITLFSIVLFTNSEARAQGIPSIKFPLVCQLDNDGDYTDGGGHVFVKPNGDLQFDISGLAPNAEYECQFRCLTGGVISEPCITDDNGKFKVVFKEAVLDGDAICVGIEVYVIRDVVSTGIREQCLVGWDFDSAVF